MTDIPTIPSTDFDWHKGVGRSSIARCRISTRFPASFYMKSARTGQTRLFITDAETMVENEFFDGEAQAYMSDGVRVQIWC